MSLHTKKIVQIRKKYIKRKKKKKRTTRKIKIVEKEKRKTNDKRRKTPIIIHNLAQILHERVFFYTRFQAKNLLKLIMVDETFNSLDVFFLLNF